MTLFELIIHTQITADKIAKANEIKSRDMQVYTEQACVDGKKFLKVLLSLVKKETNDRKETLSLDPHIRMETDKKPVFWEPSLPLLLLYTPEKLKHTSVKFKMVLFFIRGENSLFK